MQVHGTLCSYSHSQGHPILFGLTLDTGTDKGYWVEKLKFRHCIKEGNLEYKNGKKSIWDIKSY